MPNKPLQILMVEDSDLDAELTLAALMVGGIHFQCERVQTEADFRRCLAEPRFELVLSDFSLPTFSGLAALKILKELRPDLPFIFVSGAFGEDTAVDMLHQGATDYVLKQRLKRLVPAVKRAVAEAREKRERQRIEDQMRRESVMIERQREALLASERLARSEAERASRMKDEFLATLSHELRTPLNAILGWSQILLSGVRTEEDLTEGLRTIERNARAQTQIIEDLLDMSRIISGRVSLEMRRCDLLSIIQAALETVRPAAINKHVELHLHADAAETLVQGDSNRLQQVFWNLIGNAVKFTPRGGRIDVHFGCGDSQATVAIKDSGEGILPEFLPYVFDRFRQADSTIKRRHGGLGLGLAIVKQLVELHGGSVAATSEGPGYGSTFSVTLPLISPSHCNDGHRDGHADGDHGLADMRGVKVLVVDDEPDARAFVRRLLEECRAEVITAGSAKEALDRVIEHRPSLLVSDIGMPGEDGYSLIRKIRALGPEFGGNMPAIALTAYASADDRARSVDAGYQRHMSKPVESTKLIRTLAGLIGTRDGVHGATASR